MLAVAARPGIPFNPPPLLSALALVEIAASVASVGALFLAFERALHAPAVIRRAALSQCWRGTVLTAAVGLLPGIALLF